MLDICSAAMALPNEMLMEEPCKDSAPAVAHLASEQIRVIDKGNGAPISVVGRRAATGRLWQTAARTSTAAWWSPTFGMSCFRMTVTLRTTCLAGTADKELPTLASSAVRLARGLLAARLWPLTQVGTAASWRDDVGISTRGAP